MLLEPRPAGPDKPTCSNIVVVRWQAQMDSFDLVAVNLAAERSQCLVSLAASGPGRRRWCLKDLLDAESEARFVEDASLHLDLPPHGARLYQFTAIR